MAVFEKTSKQLDLHPLEKEDISLLHEFTIHRHFESGSEHRTFSQELREPWSYLRLAGLDRKKMHTKRIALER